MHIYIYIHIDEPEHKLVFSIFLFYIFTTIATAYLFFTTHITHHIRCSPTTYVLQKKKNSFIKIKQHKMIDEWNKYTTKTYVYEY